MIDAQFVHLFLIYLLLRDENEYEKWQSEGLYNEEVIAEKGFDSNTKLLRNGKKVNISEWANEIINEISQLNEHLELGKETVIKNMIERINNPEKSYAKQLIKIINNKGFIKSQTSIAKHNKKTSFESINMETIKNNEKLLEYYAKSLPNIKIE